MSCRECESYRHGGCVSPRSEREFLSDDTTPCELFAAVPTPKEKKETKHASD
jgi:hypothetical protein